MPFGRIFGAVFFAGLWAWAGLERLADSAAADRVAGAGLTLAGLSLASALLARRAWARWAGLAGAVLTAGAAIEGTAFASEELALVALLASAATIVLLAVPKTGRGTPPSGASRARLGIVEWGVVAGLAALAGAWWIAPETPAGAVADPARALPASAVLRRPAWTDFDEALDRARAEGRPVLVTFVTSWCQYCTKMREETWRSASVLERLDDLVPVRLDAEREPELAARYEIQGFPVQLLLAPDGRVLSRADGYQTPRQLLDWIDRSLGAANGAAARTSG
jgi:thiol:disulfide interchange protein